MRPRHAIAGSAPGRGAAALLLWAVLATSTVEAADENPLPAGTTAHAGIPPYLPDERRDRAALSAWCAAMETAGRARAGTRRGGDLLFSAAHARWQYLREAATALRTYAEATAHYPAGDPTRALALFQQARREAWRGHPERAEALLGDLEPWLRARPPPDLSGEDAARWQRVAALQPAVRRLRADLHEAHGRFAEAAEELGALAAAAERRGDATAAATLWERAATLRHRAGDLEAARGAIEAALALDTAPASRAQRSIWKLYLHHGLLQPDGALGTWSTWPGEDFERDLQGYLRGLAGNDAAGTYYLSTASAAFAAGRTETALSIYRLALGDRSLQEQARGRPDLWRGLLMAFPVALMLGRLDEAGRILDAVERIAGEPIEEMDGYRIALQEARAERAEQEDLESAPEAASPQTAPPSSPGEATPLGRIETGAAPPAPPGAAPLDTDVETAAPGRPSGWVLVALAAFLVLLGWRVRRRPRRSG